MRAPTRKVNMREKLYFSRKEYRLKTYDYSSEGKYFVTICTKGRENVFWETIDIKENEEYQLSREGDVVKKAIENIPAVYENTAIDKFVVMPDHIHIIISLSNKKDKTISTIINQLKGYITKQIGFSCWQKLFYDRIIRDEEEYWNICQYIDNNPINWFDDLDRYPEIHP